MTCGNNRRSRCGVCCITFWHIQGVRDARGDKVRIGEGSHFGQVRAVTERRLGEHCDARGDAGLAAAARPGKRHERRGLKALENGGHQRAAAYQGTELGGQPGAPRLFRVPRAELVLTPPADGTAAPRPAGPASSDGSNASVATGPL